MSVAFYVVLDNDEPGFDTFVNGKALAREAERLEAICQQLGLPLLDDFVSMSAEDLEDLLAEDIELPEEQVKWFTAEEGIAFVTALADHLRANPAALRNTGSVLAELEAFAKLFRQAQGIGARWHLNLDL